jgi:NitT/TauT family transport system permease protein
MGSILLIFTGQVWNMAFSFYSSLKSIPRELHEAATIYGFSPMQRFLQLELPFGAIGLLWNSMVSMAGGWFFLMACEMFVLGNRDFRLPGLGSYLQTAASAGDVGAMCWGLATMIAVIVGIDQILWRPSIAWSDRFKFEQVESSMAPGSAVLDLLRRSQILEWLSRISARVQTMMLTRFAHRKAAARKSATGPVPIFWWIGAAIGLAAIAMAIWEAIGLIGHVTGRDWLHTLGSAGATFLRVNVSLLIASLWTIPAGVAIGFHPKLARIAQPLAQVAASVPATALFPIILLALIQAGGGLEIASILLMLLGTQWYILFNVIAGALAIPSELKEVGSVFKFGSLLRWRVVILPGIFPYLVTGLVTASGGAWNASIIAEYFHLRGHVFSTYGLGAEISRASDAGRFDVLLLSTIVMAAMVVCVNRLVWRPLYRLAETRYRLET